MSKNILLFATVALLLSFIGGCATSTPMYYWGDYSDTLYQRKKNPGEETLLEHMQVLEKIVEESKARNLPVPPGVYGELGYLYLKQNKPKEAIAHFELEEKTYPESGVLMQRLIQKAEAATNTASLSENKQ